MNAHAQVGGRRGGLARQPAYAAGPAVAPAAAHAAVGAAPSGSATSHLTRLRDRVRWTLIYTSFFGFAAGVVTSRLAVGQPLILLGVIGLLLQAEPLRLGTVPTLLGGWLAWCGVGFFASGYQSVVHDGLVQVLKLTVIAVVGVNALRTRGQLRAYGMLVLAAFLAYPGRSTLLNYLAGNLLEGRAAGSGIYVNPNDLAGIALLVLSIALGLAASDRSRLVRLGSLAVAAFVVLIIFLTQSRGALLALGVFVVAAARRIPRRQRMRALGAAVLMGTCVAAFAPSSVWQRLSGLKNVTHTEDLSVVDGSAEQRYEIWKVARTIISEHPVFGVGLGAYGLEHGIVAPRPQFKRTAGGNRDTHSTYLSVAAETGLPGLVLFSIVIVATMRYAARVRRRLAGVLPDDAQRLRFLQLGMVAFLVAGIWGSYSRINLLYLHLVLIWATAKAMESDARTLGAQARAGR